MTGFSVFINENSGSVAKYGRDKLEGDLTQAMDGSLKELIFLSPQDLPDRLNEYCNQENNPVLIGGGDGTILSATELFKEKDKPFGFLPLGTMNCLAKDLGMPLDVIKLAAAYKDYREIKIDISFANDKPFLCNAMFGFPTEIAKVREDQRGNESLFKWISFVSGALEKFDMTDREFYSIHSEDDTKTVSMKAGLISNNLYDTAINIGHPFKKSTLIAGELGVYSIDPKGYLESLQLLSSLSLGAWNEQGGLTMFPAKNVHVCNGLSKMDILLDGEHTSLETPVKFRIEPKSLSLLVPSSHSMV